MWVFVIGVCALVFAAGYGLMNFSTLTQQSFNFWRLVGAGAATIVAGLGLLWPTLRGQELVELDVTEIERGGPPDSTYLKLSGTLLWEVSAVEESRGIERKVFVPMVSSGWQPGQPVTVCIEMSPKKADELAVQGERATLTGLTKTFGLPGNVRQFYKEYEEHGLLFSDSCLQFDEGADPATQGRFGTLFVVIGTAIFGGLSFLWRTDDDDRVGGGAWSGTRTARPVTPEQEEAQIEAELERDDEVRRWMESRGIDRPAANTPDGDEAAEPSTDEQRESVLTR